MDDPTLAYFITWTVYGTFLQGDLRSWRKKMEGERSPEPELNRWHSDRLTHLVQLLDDADRITVRSAIVEHCEHRQWILRACSVRTNHVHCVVSANEHGGAKIRDQLKANATRALRQTHSRWVERPVWTTKGWIDFVDTDGELDRVCLYTDFAQDRKDRDP